MTTTGELAREYLLKFPSTSKLALARKLFNDYPLVFNSVEHARTIIRLHTGACGVEKRRRVKDVIERIKLPESDSVDWSPYFIPPSVTKLLVLADIHLPYHDVDALNLALEYGKKEGINGILINGDLLDFYKASRFEQDPRMRGLKGEMDIARQFFAYLRQEFDCPIYYKLGNHCFDAETEILTKDGWKKHYQISDFDEFGTYNTNTGAIEFQKSSRIVNYHYDGEMIGVQSRGIDMLVTGGHRLYLNYKKPVTETDFEFVRAEELKTEHNRVGFKVAGTCNNKDFEEVTDDEIRICAWLHTDGSIKKVTKTASYNIYQRKSKVHMVTEILDRLKYPYSLKTRQREIKEICGKELKKQNDASCDIRILRKRGKGRIGEPIRLDEIIKEKYKLMDWVYKLSDRQFDIFLSALIDGDGTRVTGRNSLTLYGMHDFLSQVQIACIQHGYRATIKEYRNGDFKLNITKTDTIDIDKFHERNFTTHYSGTVFCVTVPNGTLVVRRNGKVHISGNCERWEKYLKLKAPELLDMEEFRLDIILKLGEFRVEYITDKRIVKHGHLDILHGHEFFGAPSQAVNPARGVFMKTLDSCVIGHLHKSSSHTDTSLGGNMITTHSIGCLCDLHPEYARINKWNLGFGINELHGKNYIFHNKRIFEGKVF